MRIPPKFISELFATFPQTVFFWLPTLSICVAYGLLGRFLRLMSINGGNNWVLTVVIGLALASLGTLAWGRGGILATFLGVGLAFKLGGVTSGAIALGVAAVALAVGFAETDAENTENLDIQQNTQRNIRDIQNNSNSSNLSLISATSTPNIPQSPKLTPREIVATGTMLVWAFWTSGEIYTTFNGLTADVVAGAIAASYATMPAQIKASGMSRGQIWQFLGLVATISGVAGWLHAWLTYRVFIPS